MNEENRGRFGGWERERERGRYKCSEDRDGDSCSAEVIKHTNRMRAG